MIITAQGKIIQGWFRKDGILIKDPASENPYKIPFAIGVEYSQAQKVAFEEIRELKAYLKNTDYKAIKYSEGAISEEEYAPIREGRAQARERINELEFPEPTLTRAEMDMAERIALDSLKNMGVVNG